MKKLDLRFLFTVKRSDDTAQFRAYLVQVNEDGNVRNLRDDYRGDPGFGLADLQITAQADLGIRFSADGGWYGLHAEYRDVFSVDGDRAEAMVKVLRKVKKAFEAVGEDVRWGRDLDSFTDTVMRALGVKGVLLDAGPNGTGNWGHDGHRYEEVTLFDAVAWANTQLAELRGVRA